MLYVIFAIALIASNWIGSKTLLERMMGKELDLPKAIWTRLTWFWGFGFVGIAIVNAYFVNTALLARQEFLDSGILVDPKIDLSNFDCAQTPLENLCLSAQRTEEAWVNFKLFGITGLLFIYMIFITLYISKASKG